MRLIVGRARRAIVTKSADSCVAPKYSSAPPCSNNRARRINLPNHLTVAIHLKNTLILLAGDENVAVGQAGRRARSGSIHFQERLAGRIESHHSTLVHLRNENVTVGQHIQTSEILI